MIGCPNNLFRSFTGLTISEFDFIYNKIASKYDKYERKRHLSKNNKKDIVPADHSN
ncbi:MAG: hypothetical protein WAM14_01530 [Candidatus Nitrosopolaris sp.]